MSQVIDAVFEHGILRPLDTLELSENDRVRLTIDRIESNGDATVEAESPNDPLAGVGMSTGIFDLAEHFDEYRFGRRSP